MNHWQESLQRISSGSVLVSTPSKTIIRFYCPIQAKCISPIAGYLSGDTVFIDGIYHGKDENLLYLIDGLKIPHSNFQIQPS